LALGKKSLLEEVKAQDIDTLLKERGETKKQVVRARLTCLQNRKDRKFGKIPFHKKQIKAPEGESFQEKRKD